MRFIDNYQEKQDFAELEKKVLAFWDENDTFSKSISLRPEKKSYRFYDGPPFATGLPHYGHLLGSTIKDVVGRYWTMRGYRVERVWGWDCHGLPIENMVEKELGLKGGKKGIEELGIEKFNAACRTSVMAYDKEWRKIINRIGRWVDMENSYKTMDNSYIESVWWAFKSLYEKGLVYEGRHVILFCPRCSTPLSNFEIAMDNSYKDVDDESIFVKFKLKGQKNTYFLAWTTTPWTLPGNVGLAVGPDIDYVKVKLGKDTLILAESKLAVLASDYEVVSRLKGTELVGLEYEPLYDYLPIGDTKAYYVVEADFVSTEEGTGIVHTAAIYGEDDYKLAIEIGLPTVPMLDDEGRFLDFVELVKGKFFKQANPIILHDLESRGLVHKIQKVTHSYPFCYRCDTPLYYSAVPAWFINIQKIKKDLLAANEAINWVPAHFKHGQFKNIIENSPDWNVSRNRYWGSPMPIWVCDSCGKKEIIGSLKELKAKAEHPESVDKLEDFHRPYIDDIKLKCSCGKTMARISEVFDCWVESASMPFAELHYPFKNTKVFEERYPADFIAEYVGQVRAWFNVLHRVSVALFGKPGFKNVVVTGVYLGSDGKKMSKSRKNYPDPALIFEKYGVDTLRFYMMSTPVMKGENVVLLEKDVDEVYKKVTNILWNVHSFLMLYKNAKVVAKPNKANIMDRWVVSVTTSALLRITDAFDSYDVVTACREIQSLVDLVSTWYLRRSRDRVKEHVDSAGTLAWVLVELAKALAPVSPFVSEVIFKELTGNESVHLADWSKADKALVDKELEEEMLIVRQIVEKGHAERKEAQVKVRQPLKELVVSKKGIRLNDELLEVLKDELNVKSVKLIDKGDALNTKLDMKLTKDLISEGLARDFVRSVQALRKEQGTKVSDLVVVEYESSEELEAVIKEFGDFIKSKALIKKLIPGSKLRLIDK